MSRLRRPVGRLRDLPIWSKLGLIMIVPTIATIVVGISGLVDHIDEANNADRARTLAVLSGRRRCASSHQLQNERAYAVDAARRHRADAGRRARADGLQAPRPARSTPRKATYRLSRRPRSTDVPDNLAHAARRASTATSSDLPGMREQIAQRARRSADAPSERATARSSTTC